MLLSRRWYSRLCFSSAVFTLLRTVQTKKELLSNQDISITKAELSGSRETTGYSKKILSDFLNCAIVLKLEPTTTVVSLVIDGRGEFEMRIFASGIRESSVSSTLVNVSLSVQLETITDKQNISCSKCSGFLDNGYTDSAMKESSSCHCV